MPGQTLTDLRYKSSVASFSQCFEHIWCFDLVVAVLFVHEVNALAWWKACCLWICAPRIQCGEGYGVTWFIFGKLFQWVCKRKSIINGNVSGILGLHECYHHHQRLWSTRRRVILSKHSFLLLRMYCVLMRFNLQLNDIRRKNVLLLCYPDPSNA